jgi:hypothetical protein
MDIALLLHHGLRENAPSEVTGHPHIELWASSPAEQHRLKVLAEQLKAFGTIPFSFKEMESADRSLQGCVIRIALAERPADATTKGDGGQ